MNRHNRGSEKRDPVDAARVAETVWIDFSALFEMFDQHLSNGLAVDRKTRSHIAEARSAAERGVVLSKQLIDRLRTAG